MKEEIDFLAEINSKYIDLENDLDQKLKQLAIEEKKLELLESKTEKLSEKRQKKQCDSYEEAKHRNQDLIKSLEMVKARLRSRATYSPIESILEKTIKAYEEEPSLVPLPSTAKETDKRIMKEFML